MNLDRCCSTLSLLAGCLVTLMLLLTILLGGTPAAFGQVDRAVLEGTVSDPSGGVIVGAGVKVVAVGTGQITSTNNFNNNNDNAASPNPGTGLPRQLQFMIRSE